MCPALPALHLRNCRKTAVVDMGDNNKAGRKDKMKNIASLNGLKQKALHGLSWSFIDNFASRGIIFLIVDIR